MKKKVLLVTASYIAHGGVESFLLNWFSQEPLNYEFTWYYPYLCVDESCAEIFKKKGVNLICGNLNYQTKSSIQRAVNIFINVHRLAIKDAYSVIHVNTGSVFVNAAALFAAKLRRIGIRIAHSHSSGALNEKKFRYFALFILRYVVNVCATRKAACSELAAKALFGRSNVKEITIVHNAIDTEKFAYSENNRRLTRLKYGIEGCFIIGQVARFSPEKNQKFLLKIFSEVVKKDNSARLLLVGEGPLEQELREYAADMCIDKYVIFAGATMEPEKYYSAMDVFVLPSLYEGLPIVGIEAQASGLPCIYSEGVTHEVMLTDNCKFISLDKSAEQWAGEILAYKNNKQNNREQAYKIVEEKDFGLSHLKKMMKLLYEADNGKI